MKPGYSTSRKLTFRWFCREHRRVPRHSEKGYLRSRFLLMWRRCHGRAPTVTTFEVSLFLGTVARRQKHLSGGFSRYSKLEKKRKIPLTLVLKRFLWNEWEIISRIRMKNWWWRKAGAGFYFSNIFQYFFLYQTVYIKK